jgi:hypothetical protein
MAGEPIGQVRQQRLPVEVPIAHGALQEHERRPLAVHGRTDGDAVGGGDVVGALVAHVLSPAKLRRSSSRLARVYRLASGNVRRGAAI